MASPDVGDVLEAQDFSIVMQLLGPGAPREPSPDGTGTPAPEPSMMASLAVTVRGHFEAGGEAGDPVAAAILRVVSSAGAGAPQGAKGGRRKPAKNAHLMSVGAGPLTVPALYDLAAAEFEAGRASQAAVFLGAILTSKPDDSEALSALALCAARLGMFDEALSIATHCLDLGDKHPRAYCVAGYCELERGNRKAAQSLLAMAARISRNRPECKNDLQAAQRLLLILHFA